jgi:UDP-glucose:(heptosyl)LPS alpha-1,3-glucosyltransferase
MRRGARLVTESRPKARLAVVSPFLNKSFGTERIVVEWIAQLVGEYEIHIYGQHVEDLDLSAVIWHRIPQLPGPHIFNFIWWIAANHVWRAWDRRIRGLRHDIVFSPGPNCLDADAVSIHIVFAEFLRRVGPNLKLSRNPVRLWPRLLHRKIYYRTVLFLERRVYSNPRIQLILTSGRTAAELERFFNRKEDFPTILAGLDHGVFNASRRNSLRAQARRQFSLAEGEFVLLLIGNDWRKKGLPALLDSMTHLRDLPVQLLVVTRESDEAQRALVCDRGLAAAVHFLPPRKDVEMYYAAADAYVGPSLEDTFALPAVEAMACGLPVIISSRAGASDVITDGVDGLILQDPTDSAKLASMIRNLYVDPDQRVRLAAQAAVTARQFTWERNGRDVAAVFEQILRRKAPSAGHGVAQES